MEIIAGFPVFPVQMTKTGRVFNPDEVTALMQHVGGLPGRRRTCWCSRTAGTTTSPTRARSTPSSSAISARFPNRNVVVLAVYWPSKKFADADLIPGGGAAAAGDTARAAELKQRLADLADGFDGGGATELAALAALVDRLGEAQARAAFVQGLRALLPADLGEDDAARRFLDIDPDDLFTALNAGVRILPAPGGGIAATSGATGGAAGIGSSAGGLVAAAQRILNLSTFYQMKARAGAVGAGLNFVLGQIRQKLPETRIHLVGHSFGARVVTAAVDGATPFAPASLVLLQGAFSHHGLSADFDGTTDGVFHNVLDQDKVAGPIVATYTANDKAVGIAYALASRISGDNRAAFGDASDPFGGLGRNGAVQGRARQGRRGHPAARRHRHRARPRQGQQPPRRPRDPRPRRRAQPRRRRRGPRRHRLTAPGRPESP